MATTPVRDRHPLSARRYLVGGAVRDGLLGRPIADRDWLVPEDSADTLLAAGFSRVGRHFPVFLCPASHEEYALPRGDDAPGASPLTRLHADLARRDFTINAMAIGPDGTLVDPHGGSTDIGRRVVRLVRARHFRDDPLRCLRAARFAATLGFSIDPATRQVMRTMALEGALGELPSERILTELLRGLASPSPAHFVRELRSAGILKVLLPEVDCLFGVPQPLRYHPEGDTGVHVLMALTASAALGADAETRLAVLLHDVGKGVTPREEWPAHHRHDTTGAPLVETIAERLGLSAHARSLARFVAEFHIRVHRALELRPATLLRVLEAAAALRPGGGVLDPALVAIEADARGRLGLTGRPYPQADWLKKVRAAALAVDTRALAASGRWSGPELGKAIRTARLEAIATLRRAPTGGARR